MNNPPADSATSPVSPRTPFRASLRSLPVTSTAGKAGTKIKVATEQPFVPVGAFCKLCRQVLKTRIRLIWKENGIFTWKHCTSSKVSFNGRKKAAMHGMQANFPGGATAWTALQVQMAQYAAAKLAGGV